MKPLFVILCLLLVTASVRAQAPLLPPVPSAGCDITINVNVNKTVTTVESRKGVAGGDPLMILADTKGEVVVWKALDPGLRFLPVAFKLADPKMTGVMAALPGKYRLLAATAILDEKGKPRPVLVDFCVEFVAAGPGPAPPKPPVPPDPTPPKPPTPPFVPPVDVLIAKLQAAFTADAAPVSVKGPQLTTLIGLYLAMVDFAADPILVKTVGDLKSNYLRVANSMLGAKSLLGLRSLIAAEMEITMLGALSADILDPMRRANVVTLFGRVALALKGVK